MTSTRTPSPLRRRAAAGAAVLTALLPLLAGCGAGGDDEADGPAVPPDIAAAARAKVADGGTLTWAVDALPATFNTFQTDADATAQRVAQATLPTLFTLDERGRPRRDPDYLTAADVQQRKPRQVVVYRINPKAVWSDGSALTAADFEAQWKALRGKDSAYWAAHNDGYDRIDRVERGANDREVRVTFDKSYADWPSLFTPLYPRSVTGTAGAFNDSARKELKTSAGPFRVEGTDTAQGTLTLARNPRWWGDRAKLDRLVLRVVPREQRVEALAARTVDLAELAPAAAERIMKVNAQDKEGSDKHRVPGAAPSSALPSGPSSGAPSASRSAASGAPSKPASASAPAAGSASRSAAGPGAAPASVRPSGSSAPAPAPSKPSGPGRGRPENKPPNRPAAADVQALRGLVVRKSLEPAYTQLALNGASGALTDERVRRAVVRAVDRKALAEYVLAPLGLPADPAGNHVLVAGQPGYQDNSDAIGGRDPKAARSLLADAGWKEGREGRAPGAKADGKAQGDAGGKAAAAPARYKDGKKLTLRLLLPKGPGTEPLRAVGERIARQLDEIGVRTEIQQVDGAGFFKDHIASGDFDLALYGWPTGAYPATEARPVFAKPQPAADGSLVVEQNYTRVGTDQIDRLFDQASTELDEEAAQDLLARADARIWAAAGSLPLYQRPELVGTRRTVANAGAFGLATPRYQDMGFLR
ncbi:hypothetical protein GCM10010218_47530 [Streptomyces mashuensis]|uniref:Solute-binding protein family 5 domain-containing protein n=1 Tax=Streptomyces mashuensis TaxID=33904 RepID=A0A919B7I0_9ACTN|nr:ABC transporter family substrate-binding protein [Streptomyces mashuensis]GHF60573.1 hypothetical protein GCM10010218_47530 [Streptomyces mashuensis]